ncbi:unnamed protein product [Tetraodon nigroviridis]|uniref:(spotted green pufferfish) hypothetical protein n=1 Tax=Tetraodon nigroviridis TaxID=99883 RepID=Q4SER2_TETNG|nr:unnamed protein product [Tetraodon nigroviridis]
MASWGTVANVLEDLDVEQNPMVTRVVQAVGRFGDVLSLEETMEPFLSADGQGSSSLPAGGRHGNQEAGEHQADLKPGNQHLHFHLFTPSRSS